MCALCHIRLFAAPWTIAPKAPPSMKFSEQEYWSRLPFPTPGYLPNLASEPHLFHLLHWQVDSLPLSHLGSPILILIIRKNESLLFSKHGWTRRDVMLSEIDQAE